jgi:hypothetical protein
MFKSLIIICFILKSSHIYAAISSNDNFLNINLDTKYSYHNEKKNVIEWSDTFTLISENQNIKKYKLENDNFKIERTVTFEDKKIEVKDKYTNKLKKKIGIISNYRLISKNSSKFYISGEQKKRSKSVKLTAENPTILFTSDVETLGIYFYDLYSKINLDIEVNSDKELKISDKNLLLDSEKYYTKIFYIYKFDRGFEYYDFINYLRQELNVNTKIDGNFFWLDPFKNKEIISNPKMLKNFLLNYNIKYLLIRPWLDYSDYNFETRRRFSREESKDYFLKLKKIIKSVDPKVKLLIPLQSNIISLNKEVQKVIKENNNLKEGFGYYYIDVKEFLLKSNLNLDKDELILNQNGEILFETYWHDDKYGSKKLVEIALPLKGYKSGHLQTKLVSQINFVLDEVEYDGVYIDQFNQYLIDPKHTISFNNQKPNMAEIDIKTGKIINEYENVVLNTLGFEKKIIDYLNTKNAFMVFNTHHLHDNLRYKNVARFGEGFWYFYAAKLWKDKNFKNFRAEQSFYASHLSTPLSLSMPVFFYLKDDSRINTHDVLVKNLRFCLFNGNLMYFNSQDIKKLNLNDQRMNIFKKIFPIEIESINPKIIKGKNKIITIKDLELKKNIFENSNVFIFDKSGYQIKNIGTRIEYKNDIIKINIDEENEILVVENKITTRN